RLQGDWSSDVCSSDLLDRPRASIIRKSSCEIPEAGHRAFRVYYVSDPGRLHGVGRAGAGAQSALVTGRTLFCIELIGGNAKHVRSEERRVGKEGKGEL